MKLLLFHHVVDLPNSEIIFVDQLARIKKSGILEENSVYYICVNGDLNKYAKLCTEVAHYSNIKIIHVHSDCSKWEWPTLNYLKQIVDNENEYSFVGYIHMKGSSQPFNPQVRDWRRLMEYFVVDNYKNCITELQTGFNSVGVNWHSGGMNWHFSGNFWWSHSEHIKTLDPLPNPDKLQMGSISSITGKIYNQNDYRYDHEGWITSKNCLAKELHHSAVNHYITLYPEEKYKI